MDLIKHVEFEEIVELGVELATLSNFGFITKLIDELVLWIVLKVCLEVVTILLFLFSQVAEEEGEVVVGSLTCAFGHPTLSPLM